MVFGFSIAVMLWTLPAFALSLDDIKSMYEDLNKHPWKNYQRLIEHQSELTSKNDLKYQWFLLRKAQAENLLYFYAKFEKTVEEAQNLIDENTPLAISSHIYRFAGLVAQQNSAYKKSETLFKKSMELADAGGLRENYILAKVDLAYTHALSELYQISLYELQDAYIEALTIDNQFLIGVINETYGATYGYLKNYKKSISYYKKAHYIYNNLKYQPYVAEAIYGIASTYRYWRKFDLAASNFKLYNKMTTYTPNREITFYGTYGLGMTLAEKGECKEALEMIEEALSMNGLSDYNAELYKRKATCLISLNQLDPAANALKEANIIFSQHTELIGTSWELETLKIESELEIAKGNSTRAYKLLAEYYKKYILVQEKSSSERLLNLRSKLEIERRDAEISLLQQKSKYQTLEAKKRHEDVIFQRYILIFAITLGVTILIAFILQRKHTKKVIAVSVRDSLSGLFNRRYIFQLLEKHLSSISPSKSELSLILLDIDDFKNINDQYGHPVGDTVINELSKVCQKTLRIDDALGRIGGEEFLCLLPRTSEKICIQVARRMLKNIEEHIFLEPHGKTFTVTVSMGVTSLSSEVTNSTTLYSQADKALYRSKQSGKNRITSFRNLP